MTQATRTGILLVAARALLLLPVFLALWYFASPVLSWIGGRVAVPVIAMATDRVAMELKERSVVYAVTLEKPYGASGAPRAEAEVEVLAPKFTYGIAFFLALCVAAKESRTRLVGIALGAAFLAVLPAIGIASNALKDLGAVAELQPFLRWGAGTREVIALGYQVGTLILPPVVPVAIWLALARPLWAPRALVA